MLDIVEKIVEIPLATNDTAGVVKGSNEVTIQGDGSLLIGSISLSKITQSTSGKISLDGGSASG